ncbi:50S ribosomal protein l19 chloroplastic [Phtheirospermum japonicum]|uniref:50S ribosomal protein l19 chloroplastic n=1 Tax=Phtheirospermum japonicum TaxID=374723 RepID=A0A830CRU6_9LAMI|nr:50S ribosomal protein l19 chloroplastic [Phtheirospermum japonicum]
MASSFLHQALFMVPKSAAQSPSKNLAFSAVVTRRCPYSGGLVSRVSTRSYGFNFMGRGENCSFVVRAEANAEVAESEENAEGVDTEEEAQVLSDDKPPRQSRTKLGDIMGILNKRAIEASDKERPIPDLRTGDIVEIKLEVPENRRRLSIYKGIVMSKQNAGIHTTIRIRRVIAGVGVEIVFPVQCYATWTGPAGLPGGDPVLSRSNGLLCKRTAFDLDGYSPNIKEIKVVKHRKVRRARLYYLRDKLPRLSTFK